MVDRSIVFYRWQSVNGQLPFTPSDVARQLASDIVRDQSKALVVGRDTTTAISVLDPGDADSRPWFKCSQFGRPNQPVEWSPGQSIRSLLMQDGHFAADVTHVCIWPDGFAAQDWHAHAPRLGRLAHLLRSQARGHVAFNTLFRPDMMATLARLRGRLRRVEIAITSPEYVDADRSGAIGTLFPAVFGHQAPSLSVAFGMGRYGPRDRYLDGATEEAVFSVAENAQEMVDRLVVAGYDPQAGRVVEVNLLTQRISQDISVGPNPEAVTLPDVTEIFEEMADARRTLDQDGLLAAAVEAQAMRA